MRSRRPGAGDRTPHRRFDGNACLPVRVWASRSDVSMLNPLVENVPVELGPKLRPVVRLKALDTKGKLTEDIIDKGDCTLLGVRIEDLQHAQPRAAINDRVLVVPSGTSRHGGEEFHVDL